MPPPADLCKPGARVVGGGGSAAPVTERIINRLSHPLFAHHDLLVAASPEDEEEVDVMVDSVLSAAPTPRAAAAGPGGATAALRHHLCAARAAAQPSLSAEAGALLAAYFRHVRAAHDAQAGVLSSLARVAAASARLRHSGVAEAVPDAALAVAFVEEKLVAAGSAPEFWPRWRAELRRCTDLGECLRGLVHDCCKGLGLGLAQRSGGGAWLEREE